MNSIGSGSCDDDVDSVDECVILRSWQPLWLVVGFVAITFIKAFSAISPFNYETRTTVSAPILLLDNSGNTNTCSCVYDSPSCKSLLLLRHAESSWKNSYFVDDINRHLSNKGIMDAHYVGQLLHHTNLKLPELVLCSPSIRTEETFNIVLGEWILGAGAHDHQNVKKKLNVKTLSKQKHDRLIKKLKENNVGVSYVDELYKLANGGYLEYLEAMLSHSSHLNDDRIMVVGHNPAMEKVLNKITSFTHQHFAPGQFYEVCFPDLVSWSDLKQAEGYVGGVLP